MAIFLITLLGFILRLTFSNQSFWLDEGASLMFAKLPLSQLLESIKTDFHPPVFYILLHFWLPLAGRSEWLIRLPFIIFATLTIPALYFLSHQLFGPKSRVPIFSALFLALNSFHIYYSQELRMYSLVTLFIILSWYFLLKKIYLLSSLFNLLGLFTFYGATFNLLSQFIYLFFNKSKNWLKDMLLIMIPSVIVFVAWWPVFSVQLTNGQYLKYALPGWQTLSGSLTIKSLILIPLKFILGRIALEPQKLYFLVGGILVVLISTFMVRSIKNKKNFPVWIAMLTPLIVATIISLKTPVLGYWRFLYILPFFLTLLAAGLETLPKLLCRVAVIGICGVFVVSNLLFWTNPKFQREDWRGLTSFLSGKRSLVLLAFPYKFAPLNFYITDALYLPMQDPSYKQLPLLKALLEEKKSDRLVVFYLDYLADLTDPDRTGLKNLPYFSLMQTAVYNFNNLGQLYEFQQL